ncbi:hypothetical protein VTI74DRAFT_10660 [Chaetomium olivicolor]
MTAVQIVRYHGRDYMSFFHPKQHDDPDFDHGLGSLTLAMAETIPASKGRYKKWLKQMRAEYAAKEQYFDQHVFPINGAPAEPGESKSGEFLRVPSELLPKRGLVLDDVTFIINLDREVFTIDYGAHFKLDKIPRKCCLWHMAVPSSLNSAGPTFPSDICEKDYVTSPALALRERVSEIGYPSRTVTAKVGIADARKHWLMRVLAEVLYEYGTTIMRFGREWAPDSFPFRELAFAVLWIASGKAKFLAFRSGICHPRTCGLDYLGYCELWDEFDAAGLGSDEDEFENLMVPDNGWFGPNWAGNDAPLLEFGSLFHRPGQLPGAAPSETMYWFDDVLVSLVLVVDCAAVTAAVTWGLQQGRANFQVVVMSLYEVVLAEVLTASRTEKAPFVKLSHPLKLSPLREEECLSTHPRERPEWREGMGHTHPSHYAVVEQSERSNTHHYPGLAALVNFLDIAAARRAAVKSTGALPPEMYCRILDHCDYETWRACAEVSPAFRSHSLLNYKLDKCTTIVPRLSSLPTDDDVLGFTVQDCTETISIKERPFRPHCRPLTEWNWMPIIGTDRRALMVDVLLEFMPQRWEKFYDLSEDDWSEDGDEESE